MDDPAGGKRRDLGHEEEHAFWAWAAVEVFRLTGIRIEELLELSHHSLVQYRLPTTGEIVPLLQIAPSKTDAERLLVVSPELADVLSAIICRIREPSGAVPLVPAYDWHECVWMPPAPLLFQRRFRTENRAISHGTLRKMLKPPWPTPGWSTPPTGSPLNYTPHDFRRIFITDAIMNGLPPHIAQVIAGHRDINVTLGYKAVYPDEAIQAHLAFLARRRACGPARNTGSPPTPNGKSSSATSNAARSPPGSADAPSAPHASTNTPACAAPCTGPTQPSGPASPRSATTSSPASLKPNAKAGSARSKDSRSASPAPTTSSPRSTGARPAPQSTSECPPRRHDREPRNQDR